MRFPNSVRRFVVVPVQSTLAYLPTRFELASPLLQSSLHLQAAADISSAPLAIMLAVARDSAMRLGLDGVCVDFALCA